MIGAAGHPYWPTAMRACLGVIMFTLAMEDVRWPKP